MSATQQALLMVGSGAEIAPTINYANKLDLFGLLSTSTMTDVTGMSVTVTPVSVTQQVTIKYSAFIGNDQANAGVFYRVAKAGAIVGAPTSPSSRVQCHGFVMNWNDTNVGNPVRGIVVDTPGVTTPVTYTFQISCPIGGANAQIGSPRGDVNDSVNGLHAPSTLFAVLEPIDVVTSTKLDTFTTTNTSFTDVTGMSVTITPTSITQPVVIDFSALVGNATTDRVTFYRISSNATGSAAMVNLPSGSLGSRIPAHGFNYTQNPTFHRGWPVSGTVVHVPGVTTPVTYTLQVANDGRGGTACVNRSGTDTDSGLWPRTSSYMTAHLAPPSMGYAAKLDQFSSASTSWVDVTGVSATISPASAIQAVVVDFSAFAGNATGNRATYFRIAKAGSMVNPPSGSIGSRVAGHGYCWVIDPNVGEACYGTVVDIPGVTTPVTYQLQVQTSSSGGTSSINSAGADDNNSNYGMRTSASLTAIRANVAP